MNDKSSKKPGNSYPTAGSENKNDPLWSALNPQSIAIIGATEDRNKVGGRPIYYMRRFGFSGGIYPVNPTHREIQGIQCYPSVADLPEVPDLALIAVNSRTTLDAVQACTMVGVPSVLVMSSGFGETGENGRRAENKLTDFASARGMRLIGPNAQGLANFRTGAVSNFSTMFMEVEPQDGPVAIVSQSGAASVIPFALMRESGVGVRYLAATGNEAEVSTADLLSAIVEDPDIRLVVLYMESVRDANKLAEAVEKARARAIDVVAMKAGVSTKGTAAAASHTGALATEDRVVDAFFRKIGVWRAHSMHELVNAVPLYLKGLPTGAGRTLVLSHSGAVGVMCADTAESIGLPMPDLSAQTKSRLRKIVPEFGNIENPIDLTSQLMTDSSLFSRALRALADDPNIDVVHLGIPVAGEGYDIEAFARAAAQLERETAKPVTVGATQASIRDVFAGQALPTFQHDADALVAIQQITMHRRLIEEAKRGRRKTRPADAIDLPLGPMLDEAQSMAILAASNIPTVRYHVASELSGVLASMTSLSPPYVLKACSAAVPHKSDHRLVVLNLSDELEVRVAFDRIQETLRALGVEGRFILAEMQRGLYELAVGAHRDPVFGPVILVGQGGKYVEALKDFQLLLPPFSEDEALEAIRSLRIAPLLAGVRGETAADTKAVARLAIRLGDIMLAEPRIDSVDMNPLLVKANGEGAIVLDALIARTLEVTDTASVSPVVAPTARS